MKILHYAPPIITNAQHNRNMAVKAHRNGIPIYQIANEWPLVFRYVDGGLEQIYDSIYAGTDLKETKYMITEISVDKAIAARERDRGDSASLG